MEKIIDMHCHILPGIDDGSKDWDETKEMLRIAYEEGTRLIVTTPHHHKKRGMCTPAEYKDRLLGIRKVIEEMGIKMKIVPGMEVNYDYDVLEKLQKKQLQTMGNSNYVLIEFSPSDDFSYIQQALQQVQMLGYYPILAHVERYNCLVGEVDDVAYLVDMGVYIQVNAGSIIGNSGRTIKKFIKELMEEELVHFVGTDAHSCRSRAPKIQESARYVEKKFGEEYAVEIFRNNGMKVIKNEII